MMDVREIEHAGLAALELCDGDVRLVVVHGVGPRIGALGLRERADLLFWDHAEAHRRGAWRLRGGHRLWVTRPGADESEDTYAPDNAACAVASSGGTVTVTAPPDAGRVERSLELRAGAGTWRVTHRLRNVGDMLWSGGAWALTCTRPAPATRYRVPLDGGPRGWDALTMVTPRRWGGVHTSRLDDPQLVLTEQALEIHARGAEAKRMLSAPRGTLIMVDPDRGVFTKRAPVVPHASYPLATNVAVYLGPAAFMVELETMSPQVTLAPGEALDHVELWTLTPPSAAG